MVGKGADGDVIDTGFGVLAEGLVGDAAGRFGLVLPADDFHCLADQVGGEIVKHNPVDAAVGHHAPHVVKTAGLDFDFQAQPLFFQVFDTYALFRFYMVDIFRMIRLV